MKQFVELKCYWTYYLCFVFMMLFLGLGSTYRRLYDDVWWEGSECAGHTVSYRSLLPVCGGLWERMRTTVGHENTNKVSTQNILLFCCPGTCQPLKQYGQLCNNMDITNGFCGCEAGLRCQSLTLSMEVGEAIKYGNHCRQDNLIGKRSPEKRFREDIGLCVRA